MTNRIPLGDEAAILPNTPLSQAQAVEKKPVATAKCIKQNLLLPHMQPRVIDVVPIDFVSGEPVERKGTPTRKFRGQLVYFTSADLTIRRPSGAILVIDRYEVVAISDGKTWFEPH